MMLFREKLYLANCDSTKSLSPGELRKRVLLGLLFADGIVLTPNILIDNQGFDEIIRERSVVKYLNEEGVGKLVIRGFLLDGWNSVREYFDKLPDNFIFSSVPGNPTKGRLTRDERSLLLERFDRLDSTMSLFRPVFESIDPSLFCLSEEIRFRAKQESLGFSTCRETERFLAGSEGLVSRSQWYEHVEKIFLCESRRDQIKKTLIDPAYYQLFIRTAEAFSQDEIKFLSGLPECLLAPGVMIRALRRELTLLEYAIKAFGLVNSAGSSQLLQYLTDEAIGFVEDKAQEYGAVFLTRRNWFGLYPWLQSKIGIEVK